jgi:hypothetical protein
MLVAYAGPETILPLSSAMAIVTGILLAFWPPVVKFLRRVLSGLAGILHAKRAPAQDPAHGSFSQHPQATEEVPEASRQPGTPQYG